jgi:hypothetical protein
MSLASKREPDAREGGREEAYGSSWEGGASLKLSGAILSTSSSTIVAIYSWKQLVS